MSAWWCISAGSANGYCVAGFVDSDAARFTIFEGGGSAGFVHAQVAVETALPPSPGGMSALRSSCGGFSLGGAVGATALANAVAVLARELSLQGTARQYGLNWKRVAMIVKRAVRYGL